MNIFKMTLTSVAVVLFAAASLYATGDERSRGLTTGESTPSSSMQACCSQKCHEHCLKSGCCTDGMTCMKTDGCTKDGATCCKDKTACCKEGEMSCGKDGKRACMKDKAACMKPAETPAEPAATAPAETPAEAMPAK